MAYRSIQCSHITDPVLAEVFEHANYYLQDSYSMLFLKPEDTGGGGCNFSIALVLLCLLDGLARDVYPTLAVGDQGTRFRQIVREKLPWEAGDDRWVDRGRAGNVLYLELRNPIAHELAQDKITSARPEGYLDSAVVKSRAGRTLSVDQIDSLSVWDPAWPVLCAISKPNGRARYVLDCGAFYWSMKKMVSDFAADNELLMQAIELRLSHDASQGSFAIGKIGNKMRTWARLQPEIRRLWLFGSRARGSNRLGSDVDTAIELTEEAAAKDAGQHGLNVWLSLEESWKKELGRLLRLPVDLERYHDVACPNVTRYVQESSILVFERS